MKLRLRRYKKDEEFLPFDEVLDTMLHELCHNVHGPHNASFYKLWDELRKVIYANLLYFDKIFNERGILYLHLIKEKEFLGELKNGPSMMIGKNKNERKF